MRNNVYKRAEDWEIMNVMEPSYTDEIMDTPLLPRFRLPQISVYSGQGDPTHHLKSYRSWMELQGAIRCKVF